MLICGYIMGSGWEVNVIFKRGVLFVLIKIPQIQLNTIPWLIFRKWCS